MEQKRYEVTNITVRPKRLGKDGKDLRTAIERVGHPVQWREGTAPNDKVIILMPGRSRIVMAMDGGIMGLQAGKFVKIREVADITTALAEHSFQRAREREDKQQVATASKEKNKKKAAAVEMGQDQHTTRGGSEHADAVNPDGNPNFLVTAPSSRGAKQKEGSGDGTVRTET